MAGKRPTYFDCEESVDSTDSEYDATTTSQKDEYAVLELPGAEKGWASDYEIEMETESVVHIEEQG